MIADAGAKPWVTLACRDRNRAVLETELAGLRHDGLATVLCVTGDGRAYDVRPDITQVFDLDGTRLAALAATMGVPVAVAETPTAPPTDVRPLRLVAKQPAGAQLAVFNHVRSPASVGHFVTTARAAGLTIPVLGSVAVFTDDRSAAVLAALPGLEIDPATVRTVLVRGRPGRRRHRRGRRGSPGSPGGRCGRRQPVGSGLRPRHRLRRLSPGRDRYADQRRFAVTDPGGSEPDPLAAEFDTVAAWTAEVAQDLGPDYYLPAGCRGSGSPALLRWFLERLDVGTRSRMLDCGAGVGGPAAFAAAETGVAPVLSDRRVRSVPRRAGTLRVAGGPGVIGAALPIFGVRRRVVPRGAVHRDGSDPPAA